MKKAKIQFSLATLFLLLAAGMVYYYFHHKIEGTKLSLVFCLALAVSIIVYLLLYYFAAGNARDAKVRTAKDKLDALVIRLLHFAFIVILVIALVILCFTVLALFYPSFLPGILRDVFDPGRTFGHLRILGYLLAALAVIQVPACIYLLVSSVFNKKDA